LPSLSIFTCKIPRLLGTGINEKDQLVFVRDFIHVPREKVVLHISVPSWNMFCSVLVPRKNNNLAPFSCERGCYFVMHFLFANQNEHRPCLIGSAREDTNMLTCLSEDLLLSDLSAVRESFSSGSHGSSAVFATRLR